MDKLATAYLLQTLEMMEQNFMSQIRAVKGLILAANAPKDVDGKPETGVQSAKNQRDFESRLGAWLEDNAGMEFGETNGIEHLSTSKEPDA
jgi:hypothetical protein